MNIEQTLTNMLAAEPPKFISINPVGGRLVTVCTQSLLERAALLVGIDVPVQETVFSTNHPEQLRGLSHEKLPGTRMVLNPDQV